MRPQPPVNRAIARIAARQQGNVTHAQLLELGLRRGAIKYRTAAGFLHRVHIGVYAVGRPPVTPLEKASAAVLATGPEAALSHASAMTLWGFWRRWDSPFEVSVAKDRRPQGIAVHRPTTLHRRDIRTHHGIRTTSPARTLNDVTPRLTDAQLSAAVNNALVSPYLTVSQLAEFIQRHANPRLQRFIPDAGTGPTRSELEREFIAFCSRYGLPTPLINVVVNGYLVDAYFPQHLLIVELDGWGFHATRHSFESDRNRDADNLADGIPTVRITHQRMKRRPQREAARLKKILASRG